MSKSATVTTFPIPHSAGNVLHLHSFQAATADPDAIKVAESMALHHELALKGEAVGSIVVVIDQNGRWKGHVAGTLVFDKITQGMIFGGFLGNLAGSR